MVSSNLIGEIFPAKLTLRNRKCQQKLTLKRNVIKLRITNKVSAKVLESAKLKSKS